MSYFDVDDENFVNVYTDGACMYNGMYGASAGIGVWFEDDHYLNISEPIPPGYRVTNQVAEILAVKKAASQALSAGVESLHIHTDSKFIIDSVTKWMPKWKKNGWKKTNRSDVVNRRVFLEMDNVLKCLVVQLTYVPAHAGIHGNVMADKFAKAGAKAYRYKYTLN